MNVLDKYGNTKWVDGRLAKFARKIILKFLPDPEDKLSAEDYKKVLLSKGYSFVDSSLTEGD